MVFQKGCETSVHSTPGPFALADDRHQEIITWEEKGSCVVSSVTEDHGGYFFPVGEALSLRLPLLGEVMLGSHHVIIEPSGTSSPGQKEPPHFWYSQILKKQDSFKRGR